MKAESEPDSENPCNVSNVDIYLSLALRHQSKASQANFYRDREKSLASHQDAVQNYKKYLKCQDATKVNLLTHLNLASSQMELGNYKEAEDEANRALEKDPKNRDAIFFQSKLLIRQGKLIPATDLLESKISSFPEDSDFLFLLGSVNRELGRLNKSVLYFTSLHDSIQKREGNPKYKIHVLKNLADLHYQLREPKKALFFYQAYLLMNPNDLDARFQVAQIYNVLGDFGASKRILEEILVKNPSNKEVELLLAEMYFVESRKTSFTYFQKIEDEDKIPKNHLVEILFATMKRDWKKSEPFLREFLPNHNARIAARLAWIEVLMAKYSATDQIAEMKSVSELTYSMRQFQLAYNLSSDLNKIIRSNGSDPKSLAYNYWFMANCMDEMGYPNRAILYSKQAVEISPEGDERDKYKMHLGHILLSDKIKRSDEGLTIANELIAKNPANGTGWYLQGYAYFQKTDYKNAINAANKSLENDPNNSGYFFFRSLIYEKLNDFTAMEQDLRKSIEYAPENPVPYNYLGFLFAEKSINKEESLRLIQKAVDLEPDNGAYQDSLGWIYFRLEKLDDAIFHLHLAKQMMADKGMEDATVFDHLGDVYKAKQDIVNAKEYWKKAIAVSKDPIEIQKIQKKITDSKKNSEA
ncbi:tetratricopeptide repeat protein [Leptospira sp. GIMC2001]|uniref:tetratricopeptide repeat protein n=1 Tax=Leptospira sp. GIMC2001 TaxID=1513297 RepID=UPI00234A76DF|nr:tetratricopeptide repeat protein [Leptospira sp. GIMC2001]WCL48317.1 tetratricopeptide repeat protein [Leptospira sp. GIMC2001]